jgi:hypothetical protein
MSTTGAVPSSGTKLQAPFKECLNVTMEPTNLYNHGKRNLFAFAAVLALLLSGGVQTAKDAQLFGFAIRAEALPTVLFFIVVYLLYQFSLARMFQTDEIRNRTKVDFAITAICSSIVLLYYLVFYLLHQIVGLGTQTLVAGCLLVAGVATGLATTRLTDFSKWRKEAIKFRKETIDSRLKEPGWYLNFNPKVPNGVKRISFESDGSIGDGQNKNETAWRLSGNSLEILNAQGERQNIFEYDAATDQFKSKGRAKAFNVEGQYIFKENAPSMNLGHY